MNNKDINSKFNRDKITVDSKNKRIKNRIECTGLLEKNRNVAVKTCNIENI
jgi:hypothetical protein